MPPRTHYGASVWHAMARGVEGRRIYGDDSDMAFFLRTLGRKASNPPISLHAFALMPNHYHLMLSASESDLSKFMHRLNTSYAMHFNHRWNRYGPLYQGRFHAVPIYRPRSALIVSCYLHQNPVPANLARTAADYPWTSYRFYAHSSAFMKPPWLDTSFLLNRLGRVPSDAVASYHRLMNLYIGDDRDSWLDLLRNGSDQDEGVMTGYYPVETR